MHRKEFSKSIDTLKSRAHFDIVFRGGVKYVTPSMTVCGLDFATFSRKVRGSRADLLLGFSVSKKVANAVRRNLLKRRIKHIIISLKHQGVVDCGCLVFVCRKGIDALPFAGLRDLIISSIASLESKSSGDIFLRSSARRPYTVGRASRDSSSDPSSQRAKFVVSGPSSRDRPLGRTYSGPEVRNLDDTCGRNC